MQNIVMIILYVIISFIFSLLLSNFISLSVDKKGKDFSIKEFLKNFNLKNNNLVYFFIFFIIISLLSRMYSGISLYVYIPVVFALILAFSIDLTFMIIPDTSSIIICICGILNLIFNFSAKNLISSFLGFSTCLIFFVVVNAICNLIVKKVGFGVGDIKIISSLGLFFGIEKILVLVFVAIITSAIYSIFYLVINRIKKKKKSIFHLDHLLFFLH